MSIELIMQSVNSFLCFHKFKLKLHYLFHFLSDDYRQHLTNFAVFESDCAIAYYNKLKLKEKMKIKNLHVSCIDLNSK